MSTSGSKVAWPDASRVGGNLNEEERRKLRDLLQEFAVALETELNKAGINILVFPIFREFNLVAGLTKSRALFITSPSFGGIPYEFWMDWRNENKDLQIEEIIMRFKLLVGWDSPSYIQFPGNVFQKDYTEKTKLLTKVARNQEANMVEKTGVESSSASVR